VETQRGGRRINVRLYIGVGLAIAATTVVLASTGPRPEREMTGTINREGGACLQLERWGLFGWDIIGQTYSVTDVRDANWHSPPALNPPCDVVPEAIYKVRMPLDARPAVFRICGLADEKACLEFTMVEFVGTPGP
jgi:hypothetical protein